MASRSMASHYVCKLVLLGNGGVGKSSIIQRFTDDGFHKVYRQTIGCDFTEKRIHVRGDIHVTLQVWDIGGQSLSSKMLPKYIYGSHIIFLCYDVTDPRSFDDLEDWLATVDRVIKMYNMKYPEVVLVGNKVDISHLRRVNPSRHHQFIDEHALSGGMFCSACSGENILKMFYKMAASALGIHLTAFELAFTEKILPVVSHTSTVGCSSDGLVTSTGRTALADQIEAEDRALEMAKGKSTCLIM